MPYIPHTESDVREMLATIGVDSIDELFREIPENLQLKGELNVPSALNEHQLFAHLKALSEKNVDLTQLTCFLGAGIYDRYSPSVVGAVISRGEFLTSYTPYQPEFSQGYLQTIYEFQTMIAELYGMDLANASMYDGATSMAEAALMAHGINGREVLAVSQAVHPHFRQVLETYAWAAGCTVRELPLTEGETKDFSSLTDDCACLIVGYPSFFGLIEDLAEARRQADRVGAQLIVVADPVAMALLPPPGSFGADVVVGEGQPLGIPMGFGGPLLGLFATKREHVRRIPGRIVGRTHDADGRPGFTMTLRTREQDIRREKATSNICTNEALMALAATVYLCALGKNGLRSVAESTVQNASYTLAKLEEAGAKRAFPGRFFGEFAVDLPRPAAQVRDALLGEGFLAGLPLGDSYAGMDHRLLVAATEVRTQAEIDAFGAALKRVLS